MREIKFRAWNAERKIMFKVGDNFGTTDPLDCVVYFKQGQTVELLQFTGLHDKNGKEIYEGDIVLASIYGDEIPSILEVRHESGCFVIDYIDADSDVVPIGRFVGQVEIISNIYEWGNNHAIR